ncbi:hypothetical protein G7Y89_g7839 [Cudoniella acicularis]|uniref:Uncharacterized protein n=1 Tax=Cudoniella acicularis TaxID=354080 RepID=A0A8H4RKG4_9HELO|nr:hypothetical protein G7Y89_g7839 [Cudoniella acicularis]
MKLSAIFSVSTLLYSSICTAALEDTHNLQRDEIPSAKLKARNATATCSLGIGRNTGSILWDVTVWNVPQAERQIDNIVATLANSYMDKGQSITVSGQMQPITITNVDNAAAFDYDVPDLVANWADPYEGLTKVQLQFDQPGANYSWTTSDCWAGTVVNSGRDSWSCDFPCTPTSN